MKKIIALMLVCLCMVNLTAFAENDGNVDYTVTASALNVREYGSLNAPIIGKLYRGNSVRGDNLGNEWVNISYNGKSAYVSRQWLTPSSASAGGGQLVYLGTYYATGYDICYSCNGNTHGITASGVPATVGRTVAMQGVAFGTQVYIEGIGYRVVEDRGCRAGIIDVLCSNHAECYKITAYRKVYIVK